jgi:hypothetical protein
MVACIALAPAVASADSHAPVSKDGDPEARSRLSITLGLFTPTGELGFEYTQIVIPALEVGAGIGIGGFGPQASVTPRLRIGDRQLLFTLGGGISGGPYSESASLCLTTDYDLCKSTNTTVVWANVEAGFQMTSAGGATLRFYGGDGRLVSHGACTGPRCDGLTGMELPYFGVAFGHTL